MPGQPLEFRSISAPWRRSKRMQATEASPVELKQEPEPSVPTPTDGIATVEQIEPEPSIAPDTDERQDLILRG